MEKILQIINIWLEDIFNKIYTLFNGEYRYD